MGFKKVFDSLTVKRMDALRKQIQSLAHFVLNHCFWTYAMLRNFENDRKKQFTLEVVFGLLSYQQEV